MTLFSSLIFYKSGKISTYQLWIATNVFNGHWVISFSIRSQKYCTVVCKTPGDIFEHFIHLNVSRFEWNFLWINYGLTTNFHKAANQNSQIPGLIDVDIYRKNDDWFKNKWNTYTFIWSKTFSADNYSASSFKFQKFHLSLIFEPRVRNTLKPYQIEGILKLFYEQSVSLLYFQMFYS